jgi:hypothetical protein
MAAGEEAMSRDPRMAPFGFFSGGSFALDHVRVFSWFETLTDLAQFLLEVEPEIYAVDGADLAEYRHKVTPVLQRLKTEGFGPALRDEFNAAIEDVFVIQWWGRFEELASAKTEFATQLVEEFLDEEIARPLADDELDEFVEYLQTCRC